MVELSNEEHLIALFVVADGERWLVASAAGRGLLVKSADLSAEKRTGRQVLNLKPGERAALCVRVTGDHVALLGSNRRLLIFPLDQVPELARGTGVALQKFKDGTLKEVRTFAQAIGLAWHEGVRPRGMSDLAEWIGGRGEAGRAAPIWVTRKA